jgi:hypothetical protein
LWVVWSAPRDFTLVEWDGGVIGGGVARDDRVAGLGLGRGRRWN